MKIKLVSKASTDTHYPRQLQHQISVDITRKLTENLKKCASRERFRVMKYSNKLPEESVITKSLKKVSKRVVIQIILHE